MPMSIKIIVCKNSSKNKENPSKNVKDQNKSGKANLDFNKTNSPKKKVTVIGDSMIKYLRCENLSSKNYEVKIAAHPRSTKEDLIDCIKPVVKKIGFLVIHVGTNDLMNRISAMKK